MTDMDIIKTVGEVGFPIAVAVYLLYERGKFNQKIVASMEKISVVLEERLPKRGGV